MLLVVNQLLLKHSQKKHSRKRAFISMPINTMLWGGSGKPRFLRFCLLKTLRRHDRRGRGRGFPEPPFISDKMH
jgi:hypothetical protein